MREACFAKLASMLILAATFATVSHSSVAGQIHVVARSQGPHFEVTANEVRDLYMGISVEVSGVSLKAVDRNEIKETRVRERFFQALFAKSPTQMRSAWSQLIFTGRGYPPETIGDLVALKKVLSERPGTLSFVDETELDGTLRSVLVLPDSPRTVVR